MLAVSAEVQGVELHNTLLRRVDFNVATTWDVVHFIIKLESQLWEDSISVWSVRAIALTSPVLVLVVPAASLLLDVVLYLKIKLARQVDVRVTTIQDSLVDTSSRAVVWLAIYVELGQVYSPVEVAGVVVPDEALAWGCELPRTPPTKGDVTWVLVDQGLTTLDGLPVLTHISTADADREETLLKCSVLFELVHEELTGLASRVMESIWRKTDNSINLKIAKALIHVLN